MLLLKSVRAAVVAGPGSMLGSILQPVGDSLASCWLEVTYFQSFAGTIYYIKIPQQNLNR